MEKVCEFKNVPAYALRAAGIELPERFVSEPFEYRRVDGSAMIGTKGYAEALGIDQALEFEERQRTYLRGLETAKAEALKKRRAEYEAKMAAIRHAEKTALAIKMAEKRRLAEARLKTAIRQEVWARLDKLNLQPAKA